MDITRLIVIGVLAVSFLVGASFIRQAYMEKIRPGTGLSKIRKASKEIQFRLRLAAGAGMLIWFITGVVWLMINW
jgi:hypothetical protein